jgi:hypothetical protein
MFVSRWVSAADVVVAVGERAEESPWQAAIASAIAIESTAMRLP